MKRIEHVIAAADEVARRHNAMVAAALIRARAFANHRHSGAERLAMAKPECKTRSSLYVKAHQAYISSSKPPKGTGRTQTKLLFSITDFEWIAWYHFSEDFSATRNGTKVVPGAQNLVGSNKATFAFKQFQPFKPRRVDEFANGDEDNSGFGIAHAALTSEPASRTKNWLTLSLTINLGGGKQFLEFNLPSSKPSQRPATSEFGKVTFLGVRKWDKANLKDAEGDFLEGMLEWESKLEVP